MYSNNASIFLSYLLFKFYLINYCLSFLTICKKTLCRQTKFYLIKKIIILSKKNESYSKLTV